MKKHEKATVIILLTLYFIVACIVCVNAQIDTAGINKAAQMGLEAAGNVITIEFPYISHTLVGLVVALVMWVIRYFEKKAMAKNNSAPTEQNN